MKLSDETLYNQYLRKHELKQNRGGRRRKRIGRWSFPKAMDSKHLQEADRRKLYAHRKKRLHPQGQASSTDFTRV